MADLVELPLSRHDYVREGPNGVKVVYTEPLTKWLRYWILKEIQPGRGRSSQEAELCRHVFVTYLRESSDVVNVLSASVDSSVSVDTADSSAGLNTLLLCSLLGEAVKEGLNYAYSRERTYRSGEKEYARPKTKNYDVNIEWKPTKLSAKLLIDAGWCISDVEVIKKRAGNYLISRMCLLSNFKRDSPSRHEQCTAAACKLTLISHDAYVSSHLSICSFAESPDRSLGHVSVEENELNSLIEKDEVPLLRFENGRIQLQDSRSSRFDQLKHSVKKWHVGRRKDASQHVPLDACQKTTYVAISHVWSQGYGNPHANSLPRCRLEDVQKLVDGLYPNRTSHVPFWMDTICIPFDSKSSLKGKAISMMHRIYREADKVLVLDNDLRCISYPGVDVSEILARVQYSTWSHRLWTFQEGALAKKLVVQLEDRGVPMDDLMKEYKTQHQRQFRSMQKAVSKSKKEGPESLDSVMYHVLHEFKEEMGFGYQFPDTYWPEEDAVARDVCDHMARHAVCPLYSEAQRFYTRLRSTREPMPKASLLAHCIEEVNWRTTSRLSDEVVCLAILLNMDMSRITNPEPTPESEPTTGAAPETTQDNVARIVEERMSRILIDLKHIPVCLVFSNAPRMQKPGFRWAPKTYINQHNSSRMEILPGEEPAVVEIYGSLSTCLTLWCPAIEIRPPPKSFRWPNSHTLYITMHGRVYAAKTLLRTFWSDVILSSEIDAQFCILLRKQFVDSVNITKFESDAALVEVVKVETETARVLFKTPLRIETLDSAALGPTEYASTVSGKSSISRKLYHFSIT